MTSEAAEPQTAEEAECMQFARKVWAFGWVRTMNLYGDGTIVTLDKAPTDTPAILHFRDLIAARDKARDQAVLEEACKAVCLRCRQGVPYGRVYPKSTDAVLMKIQGHDHGEGEPKELCKAAPIRALASQKAGQTGQEKRS